MLLTVKCPYIILIIWGILLASPMLTPVEAFQIHAGNFIQKSCPSSFKESPVILVSTDGFRADFLERGLTPTLSKLYADGVSAPFIKPSYPSMTLPNHYTIATGLLPPAHGIVANKFFAPEFNATFRTGSKEYYQQRFWGGEPIWKTVERQGKRAATYFWPGSEVEGLQPTYWLQYNESHPFDTRVKQVLDWLDLPSNKRPSFITLYMHDPDDKGHDFGPDSVQLLTSRYDLHNAKCTNKGGVWRSGDTVRNEPKGKFEYIRIFIKLNDALRSVDKTISQLIEGLKARNLFHCVNMIILADHGMAESGPERVIKAQQFSPNIGNRNLTRSWNGVFPRFEPWDGSPATTQQMINDLACKRDEMRVFHRTQLPIRWHLGGQSRVEDVVIDLDPGFQVDFDGTYKPDKGDHGYDNIFQTMNALFLAYGPAFRTNTEVESFQNIEIYNLICALLDLKPAPNNGTWGSLHHLLNNPPPIEENLDLKIPTFATLPTDSQELKARRKKSKCSSKKLYSKVWESVESATANFNRELLDIHLPWGAPQINDDTLSVKMLFHFDHITAYSERLKMPLWTAFHYERSEGSPAAKWLDDLRIDTDRLNAPCNDDNLPDKYGWEPLFHPFFSLEDQSPKIPFLTSNAVPVSNFLVKKWSQLRSLLEDYREGYAGINVILGTAFDYDNDTLSDSLFPTRTPIVPTHLYAVLTRCLGGGGLFCHPDLLDSYAFIFPQSLAASNCMEFEDFARLFTAKIDDVELISGLQFYPLLKYENRVTLKVRVHSNLWGEETWRNRLRSDTFGLKR